MKRLSSFLTVLLLPCVMGMAQGLIVENFSLNPYDLSASTHRRYDLKGQPCALVKVHLARPGAIFLGDVIGGIIYSQSEYLVYMTKDSHELEVRLDDNLSVMINFKDWSYPRLEPLSTYILSITLLDDISSMKDKGSSYFSITVTPPNATIILDDEVYSLDSDGTFIQRLPQGKHRYKLQARGYITEQGEFELGAEKVNLRKNLKSGLAELTIECPTEEVDIYINNNKMGSGPSWSGAMLAGGCLIEVRKSGYQPYKRHIVLVENQSIKVELPVPDIPVGWLDVNYKPLNAEIWIDGERMGVAPAVFKYLTVGSHQVEIRQNGYLSKTKTVSIMHGKTTSLSGTLPVAFIASPSPGVTKQTFTVNGVSFTMVRVDGGSFTMGATKELGGIAGSDEKPTHNVTVASYAIGETEVTQELWEAVTGSNPSRFKGSKRPVEQVSWDACQAFIKKLNEMTGMPFRLPTEAEWEFAARGGTKSKGYRYSGSNTIESVAWFDKNSYNMGESSSNFGTHTVATKQPNELGLYDMSGNVNEWCNDWYDENYYTNSPQSNPQGPTNGSDRTFRGGCWQFNGNICRPSNRSSYVPNGYFSDLGFRLVLSAYW